MRVETKLCLDLTSVLGMDDGGLNAGNYYVVPSATLCCRRGGHWRLRHCVSGLEVALSTPDVTPQGNSCSSAMPHLQLHLQTGRIEGLLPNTRYLGIGSKITGPDGAPSLLGHSPQLSEVGKQEHFYDGTCHRTLQAKPPPHIQSVPISLLYPTRLRQLTLEPAHRAVY